MTQNYNSSITSISYSFVLQWTLTAKEKKVIFTVDRATSVIRSILYQIKTIEDLHFCLEVEKKFCPHPGCTKHGNYLDISIKGSKMWSFKIVYAFLATKERAFGMGGCQYPRFLPYFESKFVSEDDNMIIHFVVKACPVHPTPSVEEDIKLHHKGQNTVDIESLPIIPLSSDYENEFVIDFIRRGEIPDWTVDVAINIISETKAHRCEVLKILCMEFLITRISSRYLKQILKAAIDYRLPRLETECKGKLVSSSYDIN